MFMKKGLLTLAAATCLFGLASCSSAPSTEGFDPNEGEFEKKDLTLALVGDFKAEGLPTWNPADSQDTEALKLHKDETRDGIYTVTIDITTGASFKVIAGRAWGAPDYGFAKVDTEKSTAAKIKDDGGNIGIVEGGKMTLDFYEYPFLNSDKINPDKTLIITIE
ncbi:MAG: hypothetical protein SPF22_01930 [Candidatus Onthovivens sp.]|nr:hypothetical protein [Candidatus Onthovivens sp.]